MGSTLPFESRGGKYGQLTELIDARQKEVAYQLHMPALSGSFPVYPSFQPTLLVLSIDLLW
jgi:hypothetical protein